MIPRKTDVYYRYKIPNKITIQIDTREQIPMLFPAMIMVGHPELTYKSLPIAVIAEHISLQHSPQRISEVVCCGTQGVTVGNL